MVGDQPTHRRRAPFPLGAGVHAGGGWTVVGTKFVGLKIES